LQHAPKTLIEIARLIEICFGVYTQPAFTLSEKGFVVISASFYLQSLLIIKPFYALSIFPQTVFQRLLWDVVSAESVLFATTPVSSVDSAI
jgi:hypothetical protein